MNYPMYNNNSQFYMNDLQAMKDRIDRQMQQIQQQQQQMQQPQQVPQINQSFQLAPTQSPSDFDGKYANNIDEVKNTLTLKNTFFVNKDMSILWFKNVGGDIKTYALSEIVELDPKDKEIAELKQQLAIMQNNMQQIMATQNNATNTKPVEETILEKKNNKKEGK